MVGSLPEDLRERQEAEIEAIKAIFNDDYVETHTPTAWGAVNAAHEFTLRIHPLEDVLKGSVEITLHFKLPNTYPQIGPTVSLLNPIGLSKVAITALAQKIKVTIPTLLGTEMIFELSQAAAAHITDYHQVAQHSTSLIEERETRTEELQKELFKRSEEENARLQKQRDVEREQLVAKIHADRQRRKKDIQKAKDNRSVDDLAVDTDGDHTSSTHVLERFDDGLRTPFGETVYNIAHESDAVPGNFGPRYKGKVLDVSVEHPVLVQIVRLQGTYFNSIAAKRKLQTMRQELSKLSDVNHPNVSYFYGADLTATGRSKDRSNGQRLAFVIEPDLGVTLDGFLRTCGELRHDKALNLLLQVVSGLDALHSKQITHRNLNPSNIELSLSSSVAEPQVKVSGAGWQRRLLDLNRSNNFMEVTDEATPDAWLCPSARDDPLAYTSSRDIWDAGVVFAQMLRGLELMSEYPSPESLFASSDSSWNEPLNFLQDLLNPVDNARPTACNILSHSDELLKSIYTSKKYSSHTTSSDTLVTSNETQPNTLSSPLRAIKYDKEPLNHENEQVNEQKGYFWQPRAQEPTSRYRSDFVEVEFLGKGGFGQVVKARNKLDGNFYAIKKIKLPTDPVAEEKILREVTIWSRMSHPHIVRYQTSWVETESQSLDARAALGALAESTAVKDKNSKKTEMSSAVKDVKTVGKDPKEDNDDVNDANGSDNFVDENITNDTGTISSFSDSFSLGLDDLDFLSAGHQSKSKNYPAIHFGNEDSVSRGVNDSKDPVPDKGRIFDNQSVEIDNAARTNNHPNAPLISSTRTLYIQMEFIQGITLREAIEEGISREESWRILRQILSAMLHFTSINIIHRDLKPTNVFLDSEGRVRIGDFGLAVERGVVDNGSVNDALPVANVSTDLTSDVGTTLYLAPEVLSTNNDLASSVRYTDKIDMYSLGIVFFEMWHPMRTGMERVETIRKLRKPEIVLPKSWNETAMPHQTEILKKLLCHDPAKRASPADILDSDLLPAVALDDAIQDCVREIGRPNSVYRPTFISALFSKTDEQRHKSYTYNFMNTTTDPYEGPASERILMVFERRGAIRLESPLLMPASDSYDDSFRRPVRLLDQEGTVVQLPYDLTLPFVRQVAQDPNLHRLKRFNIGHVYRNSPGVHPYPILAATYDIVSPQRNLAADAEVLQVVDEIISTFPLTQEYIHVINHSGLIDLILMNVPEKHRHDFLDAFESRSRNATGWKKLAHDLVQRYNISPRMLTFISSFDFQDDISTTLSKLEELLPNDVTKIRKIGQECREVISMASSLGLQRKIYLSPLFVTSPQLYNSGIYFQTCVKGGKKDVLAVGGRVDRLVNKYALPNAKAPHVVGCTISMNQLINAVAHEQEAISRMSTYAKREDERSYGPETPRRCDVYVVSFGDGLLEARLEVVKKLWGSGIKADLMYDGDWDGMRPEEMATTCRKEGILWLVIVKAHQFSRDQSVKVRGVLRGGEDEVSKHDLVTYLQEKIQEQLRIDTLVAEGRAAKRIGPSNSHLHSSHYNSNHYQSSATEVSKNTKVILPNASNFHVIPYHDNQKRPKMRQILWDKTIDAISSSLTKAEDAPVVAVDLDGEAFRRLTESSSWIYGEDTALRRVAEVVPAHKRGYVFNDVRKDVREVVEEYKGKCSWLWFYSMGDHDPALVSLRN